MIKNQNDLRKMATDMKDHMPDSEFFLCNVMKQFLRTVAEAITKKYGHEIETDIIYDNSSDISAYSTKDNKAVVNANNSVISSQDRLFKFKAAIAMIMHECAHLLFTDFLLFEETLKAIGSDKKLFPEPECKKEYGELLSYLATASQDEILTIQTLLKNIFNCVEDGFVDNLIIEIVKGYAPYRISYKKFLYEKDIPSFEEMNNRGEKEIEMFITFILSYAKYGKIKADLKDKNEDVIKKFFSFSKFIDKGLNETNSYFRMKYVNEVFCHFFVFVKEQLEKEDEKKNSSDHEQKNSRTEASGADGTSNQNSNNNGAQSKMENALKSIEQKISNMSNSEKTNHEVKKATVSDASTDANGNSLNLPQTDSKNGEGKECSPEAIFSDSEGITDVSKGTPDRKDYAEAIIDSLLSSAATEKAMKTVENGIANNLKQELHQVTYSNFHQGVKSVLNRNADCQIPANYESLLNELMPLSRRMSKELKRQIKKRQLGQSLNGLYTGRRISQPHRFDKKIMSKNIAPENIPNMAICLLIDESGSMNWCSNKILGTTSKIEIAKKTAFILYHFCREMKIPISIYGHSWSQSTVNLHSYSAFNSVDGKDIYRICNIKAGGSNRDGYALKFCTEQLSKQSAEKKFMMIISDGAPNAANYGMSEAIVDIQENILKPYQKKGIRFITAGIDDQINIEKIYVDGLSDKVAAKYLNIMDLEQLPKEMVTLIKKELEK